VLVTRTGVNEQAFAAANASTIRTGRARRARENADGYARRV